MFKERAFSNGKFVCSKEEFCYKEVVEDFTHAKRIGIITYNISTKDKDFLLKQLEQVDSECKIEIITNIPNRFETYYNSRLGHTYKEKARTNINTYLKKLNPENYDVKIETYFNFDNHMKIIVTDNVAYIGSANYSNESENNFEAGTITKDKEFIKYLFKEFFEEIKEESTPYYYNEYSELKIGLLRYINMVESHAEYFKYSFIELDPEGVECFSVEDTRYSLEDLDELQFILDEWNGLEALIDNMDSEIENKEDEILEIRNIYESIDTSFLREILDDSTFYEYAESDSQKLFEQQFEKYSLEAYDEYLDHYTEKALEDVQEIIGELGSNSLALIKSSISKFEKYIDDLEDFMGKVDDLSEEMVDERIDNTTR